MIRARVNTGARAAAVAGTTAGTTAVTVAVLLAVLLAGCSSGGMVATQPLTPTAAAAGSSDGPAPATTVSPCIDQETEVDPSARPLRATDRPTAATTCEYTTETVPGDGQYSLLVFRRATEIDTLLAALRLPSQPRTTGDCLALQRLPVQVLLEIDGRPVVIAPLPKDPCGQTRPEVVDAFGTLAWQETGRSRGDRLGTAVTASVGCPATRKDEFELGGLKTPPADPAPALPPTTVVQAVCVYATTYPDGWVPGDLVDGRAVAAGPVDTNRSAHLLDLLKNAVPARACTQRHTRIAAVATGDGREVTVELDGCLRILTDTYELRQGSADLVAALTATTRPLTPAPTPPTPPTPPSS